MTETEQIVYIATHRNILCFDKDNKQHIVTAKLLEIMKTQLPDNIINYIIIPPNTKIEDGCDILYKNLDKDYTDFCKSIGGYIEPGYKIIIGVNEQKQFPWYVLGSI